MTPCGKKDLKGGGISSKVSTFSQKFNSYSTQKCKSKSILFMQSLVVRVYGLRSLKIVGSLSPEVPSFWEVFPCGFPPQGLFFFLKPSLGLQVRIIGFCMVYFLTSFHSVKVVTCTTKWEADGWESHHHQSKTPTEPTTHSSSCHCTGRHPAEAQGPDPQCLTSSIPAGVKNKHLWEKWPQVTCKVLQAGTEPHQLLSPWEPE